MDDEPFVAYANTAQAPPSQAQVRGYPATAFDPARFAKLQPRRWVYGHFLIRRFLSVLGGPGGVGKTSYAIAVALAIVLEDDILRERVAQGGSVWIINLEDPLDEIDRRIWAACIAHNIDPQILAGKLFTDSGRDKPLVIAARDRESGNIIAQPVYDDLLAELQARKVVALFVDPFVKSHGLAENSNDEMDYVTNKWSKIAESADCAVMLLHHFRKGAATNPDADSFRGASALIDASRAAVALAVMSSDEAQSFGIPETERRGYVRADNAKLNLAPPPAEAVWLRLQSVELPTGDFVQAAVRWEPSSPWDGMSMSTSIKALREISDGPSQGEQFAATINSTDRTRWAGSVVMRLAGKTEAQAKAIIRLWVINGVIAAARYFSPGQRKERSGLTVDLVKVSEMERQIAPADDAAPLSDE